MIAYVKGQRLSAAHQQTYNFLVSACTSVAEA